MKKAIFFILIFFTCFTVFGQQKHALVIGNDIYAGSMWSNLRNAVNDATDMKTALESLGFQVDLLLNANLSQMQMAIINFKQRLRSSPNTYGFFYFAGHGAQDRNNHDYLIPVDADTPSLNLLSQRAIPVQFLMDELAEARNELNMIVLDACRDVPSLDRSGSRGLSTVSNAPRGSIVIYATAANKVAGDGTGRNGLFTSHLLKNLTTPGLTVNEIFTRTGADVARATRGDQYPEIRQMYHETAYLSTRTTPTPTPAPVPVPPTPVYQAQPVTVPSGSISMRGRAIQEMEVEGLYIYHASLPLNRKVILINPVTERGLEVTIIGRIAADDNRFVDVSLDVWRALELNHDNSTVLMWVLPR